MRDGCDHDYRIELGGYGDDSTGDSYHDILKCDKCGHVGGRSAPHNSPEYDPNWTDNPNESQGPACFVATAVYGDVNAPQVEKLRQLRDDELMKTDLGRMLVDSYYGGLGRKVASFIENHVPSTIPALRKVLDNLTRD